MPQEKHGVTWEMFRNLTTPQREELLTHVNEIWTHGEVPPFLKHAVVTPIPKRAKDVSET